MTALDALHHAHQAWIRTQPQLFFELDGLDEPSVAFPPFVGGGLVEPDGSQVAPVHADPTSGRSYCLASGMASGRHPLPVPSTNDCGPTATSRESRAVGPQGGQA